MNKGKIKIFVKDDVFTFDADLYEVDAETDRQWVYVRASYFLTEEEQKKLQMSCYMFPVSAITRIEY